MKNFTILLAKQVALFLTALAFGCFLIGCANDFESNLPEENLDTTAPIIITQPAIGVANDTSITVTIAANEGGRIFWILYSVGTVPTYSNGDAFVDAAKSRTAGVKRSGEASVSITANVLTTITITQLTPETACDFYAVVEDAAGNPSMLSSKLDVTTTATPDIIAPAITEQPMLRGEAEDTSITVTISANERGRIFWILYPAGIVPPYSNGDAFVDAAKGETAGIKRSGEAGVSITANVSANISITQLTLVTDYDFYAVVEDVAGNPSAMSDKLNVATARHTSWNMSDAKWGIGHHYISNRFGLVGQYAAWREYVNNFNVSKYAELAKKLGAGWVLIHALSDITNTPSDIYDQNSPPCTSKYPECVHQPGTDRADYTGDRDLVLELAKALHKKRHSNDGVFHNGSN